MHYLRDMLSQFYHEGIVLIMPISEVVNAESCEGKASYERRNVIGVASQLHCSTTQLQLSKRERCVDLWSWLDLLGPLCLSHKLHHLPHRPRDRTHGKQQDAIGERHEGRFQEAALRRVVSNSRSQNQRPANSIYSSSPDHPSAFKQTHPGIAPD